jgi:hypothetical protein
MSLRILINRSLPILLMLSADAAFTQSTEYDRLVYNYIERFKYIAIQEMKQYGIPASITLAQGILESNAGRSDLAVKANNHFGIKCHKEWAGPTIYQDDDKLNECFRKYSDPVDSYRDHSLFLTSRERYKGLFSLKPDDYKAWAEGLRTAGYATNPDYPRLLINMIERFSLYQYDRVETAVPKMPPAVSPTGNPVFKNIKYSYFAPGPGGRETYTNNHTWFTFAGKGETLEALSEAFGISASKLRRFNDLEKRESIREGDPVYLSMKPGKAEAKAHKAENGQSMWEISQIYAVQLKKLCRRNGMATGQQPVAGTLLILR